MARRLETTVVLVAGSFKYRGWMRTTRGRIRAGPSTPTDRSTLRSPFKFSVCIFYIDILDTQQSILSLFLSFHLAEWNLFFSFLLFFFFPLSTSTNSIITLPFVSLSLSLRTLCKLLDFGLVFCRLCNSVTIQLPSAFRPNSSRDVGRLCVRFSLQLFFS